jgi:hypothetical protein
VKIRLKIRLQNLIPYAKTSRDFCMESLREKELSKHKVILIDTSYS